MPLATALAVAAATRALPRPGVHRMGAAVAPGAAARRGGAPGGLAYLRAVFEPASARAQEAPMKFGIIPTEGARCSRRRSRRSCSRRSWASTRCGWRSTTRIPGHYWPSPLVVLAAFGARTSGSCWAPMSSSRPSITRCAWPRTSRSSSRSRATG